MSAAETAVLPGSQVPAGLSSELEDEFRRAHSNGRVGSRLVSQTDRVRVWHLTLAPGERIGFHRHVLDYFWTAVTAGRGRSHYGDGRVVEVDYAAGDTRHHTYAAGESMMHDLTNIGDTTLSFVTVEFVESANRPLAL